MTHPVVLFGATGYTGRLVAEALCRRGVRFTIAGRNFEKLQSLARELPWRPDIAEGFVEFPESLEPIFAGRRVVLNCVGPFMRHGESVVAAAIKAGAHYADTTGELPFMRKVIERFHNDAKRAGVAVAPAMAYEVALADCAAARIGADFGPADEVEVLYHLRGIHASRGTALSAIGVMREGGMRYENGHYQRERAAREIRRIPLPKPPGDTWSLSFPSGEVASIPLHVDANKVAAFMAVPRVLARGGKVAGAALAPLARLAGGVLERQLAGLRDGPTAKERETTEFVVSVRLFRKDYWTQALVRGRDMYATTGWIMAYAAEQMLSSAPRPGVVAPAQVLEPNAFFGELRGVGIDYQVRSSAP